MDQNIPFGQLQVALQSGFDCPHRALAQRHPLLVHLPAEFNDRVNPLPRHTLRPLQHCLYIHQFGPVPVQFQDAPTPLDRVVFTVVRGIIEQLNRLANGIAKRHHPMQKLRPPPTAFWAVIHFDLQPRHRLLRCFIQRRPPGLKRVDNEITGLVRTAKGDVQLTAIFIHNSTRNVLFLQAQVMIPGPVIAPGAAAA